MQEVRDSIEDARIARDRLLGALDGCIDPETRLSLWRAAKRFNEKYRAERALEIDAPRAGHSLVGGEPSACWGMDW